MKILITGINGQVGAAIVHQAKAEGYKIVPISRDQWDMAKSPELGKDLVLRSKPDLVINAAAYTNVNDAEKDESSALTVNADAPRSLAKACRHLDIPIFHVSTDYVFDGVKAEPYLETDETNPINAYGRTKLAGELAIKKETDKYIIIRTSAVFSKNGINFVNKILKNANELDVFSVVVDQSTGPTSANCIAKILLKFANNHNDKYGLYHYSGCPHISWYEYANVILNYCNEYGLICNPAKILPSFTDKASFIKRPQFSNLNSDKIADLLNIPLCNWKKEIEEILIDIMKFK